MEIRFEGLKELKRGLKERVTLNDVKKVVRHNGAELTKKMQENADFKKGYATGQTKDSIMLTIKDNGLTAEVKPTTEYAAYLEFGTRFMDAQPYVKPAFDVQKEKFDKDMDKLAR